MAGGAKADTIVDRILKKPAAERLKLLRESTNPQAQFLWAILRDSFHYAAVHLADIADSAREIDFAMRWGFGARQGPFELWQDAGWKQVAEWIKEDIDAGKALSTAPLPAWVFDGRDGVHTAEGSWSAAQGKYLPVSTLDVYKRQPFPETVLGAGGASALKSGTEEFRNDEVRVWTLDGEVLIASITAKLHLISPTVTEGLLKAVEIAEAKYKGLVIWSPDEMFSAGANLEALMPVFMKMGAKGIAPEEKKLQDMMLRLRYSTVPVVSAIRGIALGGGCELAVYSSARVAAIGKLHGPGRSRRRPRAGRRRPDLHRASRGRERRQGAGLGPAGVPEGRRGRRGLGHGGHQRARVAQDRLPARFRHRRPAQGRAAVRGPRRRPGRCTRRGIARRSSA